MYDDSYVAAVYACAYGAIYMLAIYVASYITMCIAIAIYAYNRLHSYIVSYLCTNSYRSSKTIYGEKAIAK